MTMENYKICTKCFIEKEFSQFSKNTTGKFGLRPDCKVCERERKSKYLEENKERINSDIRVKTKANSELKFQQKVDALKNKLIGVEFGSFVVTKYLGFSKRREDEKHNRHLFESECRFCKVKTVKIPGTIEKYIKTQPTCILCNESVKVDEGIKKCFSCQTWKPSTKEYFPMSKNRRFGIHYYCLPCQSNKNALRRKNPLVRKKELLQRENRKKTNPLFKFRTNTSSYLKNAIINYGYSKKTNAYKILGETREVVRAHIESLFDDDMNWENYGRTGWHMDHKISLSTAKTIEELKKLYHYKNIQPMWALKNMRKGNKNDDWYENRKY
jgi:hypothetical protein